MVRIIAAAMDEEKHNITLARIRSAPPSVMRIEEADYPAAAVDPSAGDRRGRGVVSGAPVGLFRTAKLGVQNMCSRCKNSFR